MKYIQSTLKIQHKKMNNLTKKWAKDLNRHLTKEDTEMAKKEKKEKEKMVHIVCNQGNTIKTMRCHYTLIRMAKIQNTDTTKCW